MAGDGFGKARDAHVVVLTSTSPFVGIYGVGSLRFEADRRPLSYHVGSLAPYPHTLTRTGERRLELSPRGGRMLDTDFEQVFRASVYPLRQGDTAHTDAFDVEVLEVVDGKPVRIALTFAFALDDPKLLLVNHGRDGVTEVVPPTMGESITLSVALMPWER
jgi:hypothetical protein